MMIGLPSGIVLVVPYDEEWPALFAETRDGILAALGALPAEVEHVGSTSVPGLAAKPVIDVMIGRPAESALEPYVRALQGAGYEYRSEYGLPGRHYFVR